MRVGTNYVTGQLLCDTTWKKVPMSGTHKTFILYVEGADILLFIGDNPVNNKAFKVVGGAALEWPNGTGDVWVRGEDAETVVYYIG